MGVRRRLRAVHAISVRGQEFARFVAPRVRCRWPGGRTDSEPLWSKPASAHEKSKQEKGLRGPRPSAC